MQMLWLKLAFYNMAALMQRHEKQKKRLLEYLINLWDAMNENMHANLKISKIELESTILL